MQDNFSLTTNDIKLFTDASSIGFGPYMTTLGFRKNGHYHLYTTRLIIKNYLQSGHPVSLGAHTGRKRIVFITDNKPITELWQSGSSPSVQLMDLIRKIHSTAVQYHFSISFKHIPGHYSPVADAISRHLQTTYEHLYQTTYGQTDNPPPPPPPQTQTTQL